MHPLTELLHGGARSDDPHGALAPPIYQTATFEQSRADAFDRYDYSRSGNPTRDLLEAQLARLEHGCDALALASGMAALTLLTRIVRPGERIVAGRDLYGGTLRLLQRLAERHGIQVAQVDTTQPSALADALREDTRLVLVETPGNPRLQVTDIAAAARLAHGAGALLAVDNTMLSPWLQQPLRLGADVVVHSATKHLCGHSDVTAGALVVDDQELASELRFLQNAEGAALAPFDSWLLLRGLKTLGLRMAHQQRGARTVARWLARRPEVRRVCYPGLADHPGHALNRRQARGAGCVLSFETESGLARSLVQGTRLFKTAVSFGSVTSQISLPACMSHASAPDAGGIPPGLVRLSVGSEHPPDLIADLEAALRGATLVSMA